MPAFWQRAEDPLGSIRLLAAPWQCAAKRCEPGAEPAALCRGAARPPPGQVVVAGARAGQLCPSRQSRDCCGPWSLADQRFCGTPAGSATAARASPPKGARAAQADTMLGINVAARCVASAPPQPELRRQRRRLQGGTQVRRALARQQPRAAGSASTQPRCLVTLNSNKHTACRVPTRSCWCQPLPAAALAGAAPAMPAARGGGSTAGQAAGGHPRSSSLQG